jgi:hypothetical protein
MDREYVASELVKVARDLTAASLPPEMERLQKPFSKAVNKVIDGIQEYNMVMSELSDMKDYPPAVSIGTRGMGTARQRIDSWMAIMDDFTVLRDEMKNFKGVDSQTPEEIRAGVRDGLYKLIRNISDPSSGTQVGVERDGSIFSSFRSSNLPNSAQELRDVGGDRGYDKLLKREISNLKRGVNKYLTPWKKEIKDVKIIDHPAYKAPGWIWFEIKLK